MNDTTSLTSLPRATSSGPKWQVWLGLVVLLGSIATIAYAFFATFNG